MNDTNATQQQTDTNIQDYLSDIATQWGIDLLSPEEQEEFLGDLADALYESVLLDVAVQLSDTDRDALTTLIERASADTDNDAHQEAVFSFLKLKVPNLNEIIKFEAEKLKQEYLALQEQVSQGK